MVNRFAISRGVSPRESFDQVAELAKSVENHGFEALWFIDHQLGMKDVYTAMNVSAMATEKIHIGSAVTNLQTRHPTVTANATTALDDLSKDRAMLGIGAGWVAVHSIGQKPNKLAEIRKGIEDFRILFSGEETELYGTKVRLATARRQIPIYLAVSQPGMLRLCGEVCDGAILMGAADPEFCRWQLDYIYEGLEKAGRKRSEITIDLTVTISIDQDVEQALSDVRAWATSQAATFAVWKRMPPAWERFREEFTRAEQAYHFEDHLSLRAEHKHLVSDEFVQSVAVAGNMETSLARLREVAALDIDRITFALLSGGRQRRLEEFANKVIPELTKGS
ncbi:MAG: LLM class flavin-dependent oxidoreductase [SAR324 cluster bacterium]|nr:LLM class flavin-dependent oxidoreductase [SAR324 cluster bacterium]